MCAPFTSACAWVTLAPLLPFSFWPLFRDFVLVCRRLPLLLFLAFLPPTCVLLQSRCPSLGLSLSGLVLFPAAASLTLSGTPQKVHLKCSHAAAHCRAAARSIVVTVRSAAFAAKRAYVRRVLGSVPTRTWAVLSFCYSTV